MSAITPQPKLITVIRSNRARLLRLGLNRSELTMLEEIALLTQTRRLRLLRGAYLAKYLGCSPQWANQLLRRLSAANLILRMKTGLIRLNMEKLHDISANGLKIIRRKTSKWLKTLRQSRRRNRHIPIKEETYKTSNDLPNLTRSEALDALKTSYIPVHLRKSQ